MSTGRERLLSPQCFEPARAPGQVGKYPDRGSANPQAAVTGGQVKSVFEFCESRGPKFNSAQDLPP